MSTDQNQVNIDLLKNTVFDVHHPNYQGIVIRERTVHRLFENRISGTESLDSVINRNMDKLDLLQKITNNGAI
jgi:hypothetical protein